jgi:SOS-response transcriptional repressor LexA
MLKDTQNVADRIKYALDHAKSMLGKSNTQVATESGATKTTLSGWQDRGSIPSSKLISFSRATGVNVMWILGEEGPIFTDENIAKAPVLNLQEVTRFVDSREYSREGRDYIELDSRYAGNASNMFALIVPDDAMEGELYKGETVTVDTSSKTEMADNGVFLIENAGVVLIRKYINNGIKEILAPLNPLAQYPVITISKANPVRHLGRIEIKTFHFPSK